MGVSPRRNKPSRPRPPTARPDVERARYGVAAIETWRGEQWRVRQIPGPAAVKTYRCPGCDHEIRPGVPHLVVWPLDGLPGSGSAEADRRHWHTACWRARDRRRP